MNGALLALGAMAARSMQRREDVAAMQEVFATMVGVGKFCTGGGAVSPTPRVWHPRSRDPEHRGRRKADGLRVADPRPLGGLHDPARFSLTTKGGSVPTRPKDKGVEYAHVS